MNLCANMGCNKPAAHKIKMKQGGHQSTGAKNATSGGLPRREP